MQVMPEQARAEAHWWYNPLYIIHDLNVNSVIAKPDHNDLLLLPYGDEDDATYTMQGYAYAGGGRRVARVEISLDGGDNWTLVSLTYPEDLYRTARFEDEIYGTFDLTERETCL
jgi:nitrate reductase (NAD(P)H)